jgi:nitronate monooxygenase
VARAQATGAVTIHQVTTVAEAEYASKVGVDVLIAQGREAGGHMGPMPLWTLLPEVVRVAGSRPVLAAGGIVDGQGLAAALSFGAAGVLMGTRFLATPEAPAREVHKQAILNAQLGDTVASGIADILWGMEWPGVKVRMLRNQLTARWEGREDELKSAAEIVRAELAEAEASMNPAVLLLLTGEGSARIHEIKPAGEIVRDVVAQAERVIRGLNELID